MAGHGSDGGPLLSKAADKFLSTNLELFQSFKFPPGVMKINQPKKGSIVGEIPQNDPYLIHLHCLIPPKL